MATLAACGGSLLANTTTDGGWAMGRHRLNSGQLGGFSLKENNMKKAAISWIVKSGDGHFVRFQDSTPEMTTDPVEAYRMDYESARNVKKLLEQCGFEAELVSVRVAKKSA